jgi:hypothetical protein
LRQDAFAADHETESRADRGDQQALRGCFHGAISYLNSKRSFWRISIRHQIAQIGGVKRRAPPT